MLIIGCDYHPSVQQIAFVDSATGESTDQRLNHSDGEAERFYRGYKAAASAYEWAWRPPGMPVVRAVTGGTKVRAVDWRSGSN